MPSPLEVLTKTQEASTSNPTVVESSEKVGKESPACELGALQNGDNSSQKNQYQKRSQPPMTLHGSPRRNFVNRSSSVPQNGYRQNRNHSGNKRPTHDTNSAPKHFGYKGSAAMQQNQQNVTPSQAPNEYSHHQKHSVNGHVDSKKPSNPCRSITKTSKMTSYHYDDAPSQPPANEAESNGSSQSKHHHRYTRYYLEQVGDRMTEGVRLSQPSKHQKHIPDEKLLAIKAAFGDNSGYYGQFYSGALYSNQQAMYQQQFHQQLFARFQQSQHQHQQQQQQVERQYRMYSQGQQENYQKFYQHSHIYESESSPPLISYANQQSQQRNYQQGYLSSPSYQNRNKNERREYRDNPKKKGYGYHNGNNVNNVRNGEPEYKHDNQPQRNAQFGKSRSFNEQDNKRKDIQRDRPEDEHAWRSLSPTPPGSSKSSSPGAIDKCTCTDKDLRDTQSHLSHLELGDDSASTASASSIPSSTSSFAGRGMKESISTPILLAPEGPTQSVNLWINNNFGGALHNGHSVSAEQLNRETKSIIKRPPSSSGSSRKSLIQMPSAHSVPSYDPQNPFEYYLSRSAESEMRAIPAELKCGTAWNHVSLAMWEKFQQFQQSHTTYHKKMLMWRDLHNAIKSFPLFHQKAVAKWGLYLVGSTISGFGADLSDVDMVLVYKGAHQDLRIDARMEAMVTLNDLKNFLISTMSPFKNFSLINAKVPILRFRDSTNTIEIDLNYNNCIGVRNTQLLFSYSQLDWRLRPLALIVKLWAQYHNINDARNSTISSYSLVLMVIHFLQQAQPAVLPCLHRLCPDKFNTHQDISTIDMVEKCEVNWKSDNGQSLGLLFLRFLDYYSNFEYEKYAISVRTGGVLQIEECKNARSPKNDPNHWLTLCIEEPFDLTNTARSAYDTSIFDSIKKVFFDSFCCLNEHKDLQALFHKPMFNPGQQTTPQYMPQHSQLKYMMMPNAHGTMAQLSDVRS